MTFFMSLLTCLFPPHFNGVSCFCDYNISRAVYILESPFPRVLIWYIIMTVPYHIDTIKPQSRGPSQPPKQSATKLKHRDRFKVHKLPKHDNWLDHVRRVMDFHFPLHKQAWFIGVCCLYVRKSFKGWHLFWPQLYKICDVHLWG